MKAGIIGCGGIAKPHAAGYAALGVEIIGVTDVNKETAEAFAKEHGGKVYADYKALIDEAGPDVVSICTPPVAHEEAAVYALGKGVNVLCEKPMAYDVASAHRMKAAADASKALFMPAFRHRFLPGTMALRKLVQSGKLGDIVIFNNIFGGPSFKMEDKWFTKKKIAGGGCILDTNSHSVDLFRYIVGEVADEKAFMHRHFKTTDVEDAGILIMKAENGAMGSVESGFVLGSGAAYIDIFGTKGRAIFDYYKPLEVRYMPMGDTEWTVEEIPECPAAGFAEEIAHFVGAIKGENKLAITAQDGVRAMEIICGVYK